MMKMMKMPPEKQRGAASLSTGVLALYGKPLHLISGCCGRRPLFAKDVHIRRHPELHGVIGPIDRIERMEQLVRFIVAPDPGQRLLLGTGTV